MTLFLWFSCSVQKILHLAVKIWCMPPGLKYGIWKTGLEENCHKLRLLTLPIYFSQSNYVYIWFSHMISKLEIQRRIFILHRNPFFWQKNYKPKTCSLPRHVRRWQAGLFCIQNNVLGRTVKGILPRAWLEQKYEIGRENLQEMGWKAFKSNPFHNNFR